VQLGTFGESGCPKLFRELKVRGERKGKRCHARAKDASREAEALDDIMVIRNRGIALYAPILPPGRGGSVKASGNTFVPRGRRIGI